MKNCIFCQIVKGEIPKDFVYQDNDLVAFDDINPLSPIHILIVPKEHIEGIQTVQKKDEKILGKMLLASRKIAEEKNLEGYKLLFNCGKLGSQAIFHLHLHLISGWKDASDFLKLVKKRLEEGGVL